MEIKKSPKADLQNKRGLLLEIGLVVALILVIAAFAYTPKEYRIEKPDLNYAPVEEEITEITRQDQKPPEPPKKVEVKVIAALLQVVTDGTKITTGVDFAEFDENTEVVQQVEVVEETIEDDQPFLIAETMPLFPMQEGGNPGYGDLNTFRAWVQKNIKYPAEAFRNGEQGRVVLSFVVEKDGSVSNIQILQTPGKAFSEETRRVVAASPKWKPGEQRGEKVRVRYTLPVDFRITATAQDTKTSENKGSGEEPFLVVDTPPQFNGGDIGEFRRWVQMNVKYPAEALGKNIYGKVLVTFVIEKDGSVGNAEIFKSPDKSLADEVLRVIGKSPKWTPGKQRGEAVRVKFGMPVDFAVQTSEGILHDKDTAQREGDMEEILVVGYGTQKK